MSDDDFATRPEPVFLGSVATDQLAGMVLTLGMELSVLAARVAELEGRDPDADSQSADAIVRRLLASTRPSGGQARPLVAEQLVTEPGPAVAP